MFVTLDRRPGFEGGDTALHGLILGSSLQKLPEVVL